MQESAMAHMGAIDCTYIHVATIRYIITICCIIVQRNYNVITNLAFPVITQFCKKSTVLRSDHNYKTLTFLQPTIYTQEKERFHAKCFFWHKKFIYGGICISLCIIIHAYVILYISLKSSTYACLIIISYWIYVIFSDKQAQIHRENLCNLHVYTVCRACSGLP